MSAVEDVSLEDVKRGLADGSILLIDVREDNEWAAGHVPGAFHVELANVNDLSPAGSSGRAPWSWTGIRTPLVGSSVQR